MGCAFQGQREEYDKEEEGRGRGRGRESTCAKTIATLRTQVQELVLHRDPALLDEVVPLLISEFQVRRGMEGVQAGGKAGRRGMRRQRGAVQ